jgi:hypothetical protein
MPFSLRDFCLGDYKTCPTWRTDKEAVEAGKRGALEALNG